MPSNLKNLKVSVCVISYNQEQYIKNCLERILGQKTNFNFDIVIGEDCSTDNTAAIIKQFIDSNNNIRLLDNNINIGALPNFVRSLHACTGKYVAFCEGDDFWVDENKLQKQVDFLEDNPKYGGVSTNNKWYIENEDTYETSILEEGEISFEELCRNNLINSQTMLFKREFIKDIDWMKALKIGDWALHLLVASQQPYYRLPEITAVYRVHEGGIHSLLREEFKIKNRLGVLIAVLENVNLSEKRKTLLKESIKRLLLKLVAYQPKDIKIIRRQFYDFGGSFFNKTILKSYIK